MLSKQELDAALAAERAMYRALSEVQDITRELLDAVDRQDQVSVRLFLSMRQEQINQLRDQKELLKKQCGGLPKEEGDLLRQILSGKKPAGVEGEALSLPGGTEPRAVRADASGGQGSEQAAGGERVFLPKLSQAAVWWKKALCRHLAGRGSLMSF